MASFSITGFNVSRCPQFCTYCSAASIMNYEMGVKKDVKAMEEIDNYVFEKEYKADWKAVAETIKNDPQIINEKKNKYIHFDLWGADSTTNLRMIEDMRVNLTKICNDLGYENISFSDSTGGIGLLRDEVADYHRKHNIHIQLSHDGLGQFLRTRDIDILAYDNTKALIKEGILNAVNTTLNFYNCNMMANFRFWDDYLKQLFPNIYSPTAIATEQETKIWQGLYIKLNHIYNGTPPSPAINKEGIFNSKKYGQLAGEPLGDFNLINDRERAEKYKIPEMAHVLDDYIHSYIMLIGKMGTLSAMPFYNYLNEQLKRFCIKKDDNEKTGSCRAYQRFRHNIGEKRSQNSTTFVIDTLGRYSECNLIDSRHVVKNPGGVQPKYCSSCVYKNSSECLTCGCEDFPDHCEYAYRWNQLIEAAANGIFRIPSKYSLQQQMEDLKRSK